MRKFGFIILGASLIFTFVAGIPKFDDAKIAKQEYISLRDEVQEEKKNLESLYDEEDDAKNDIDSIRNSNISPKDFRTVTQNINDIRGATITKISTYCYDEDMLDSVLVEVDSVSDLAEFDSYGKLVEPVTYTIECKSITDILAAISSMKLYVTSINIDSENSVITLAINFMGGE